MNPTASANAFETGSASAADWSSQNITDDEWKQTETGRYPDTRSRDWKKAFLIVGLASLSWVATYIGMLELIQSNLGDLSFSHKVIVGFSVAMLMTMIIWLLDQMFAPLPAITKLAYGLGYIFLTLISVGFGFGFYWKVLESRSEASRSAASAVGQIQTALFAASARLDQLETTLGQLTKISSAKAVEERERGTTCPRSRPGDGPRRKLRDADAEQFAFAAQFVRDRAQKTRKDMSALDLDLKRITTSDPETFDPKTGTRNAFLGGLSRRLDLTAAGFNAFRTDPQLRQIRSELAQRAAKTVFPTARGRTFSCPDPQLQSALRGVVRAIDQLPELSRPRIATVEGAQAVVEAFRRLSTTLYGAVTLELPPTADELRALQRKAVQSVERTKPGQADALLENGGLSKRDYIPLAIAIFVDLCLLLVSIGRPMNRLHGLVPKMRAAERGPVYQILSRFDDIHRNSQIRDKFEVFRHVVFDFNGDYYVAVPLDAPNTTSTEEAEKLQQEAHLLANLFASFENENIFSRVYTPLLSRRTIRRKLKRQGSKFADSQTFRIYRFRDGAWSEIILGAIMGASRGLPTLTSQLNQTVASDFAPSQSETSSIDTWSPAQTKSDCDESALSRDRELAARPESPDARLAAQYGPYASSIVSQMEAAAAPVSFEAQVGDSSDPSHTNPLDSDGTRGVASTTRSRSSAKTDQYDNTLSNVISMSRSRPQNSSDCARVRPKDPVMIDTNADNKHPAPFASESLHVHPTQNHEQAQVRMHVCERTAQFGVPVTDAKLPERFLDTLGSLSTEQLSLRFDPTTSVNSRQLSTHDALASDLAIQPVESRRRLGVDDVRSAVAPLNGRISDASPIAVDLNDDVGTDIGTVEEEDDPMLRVAERFAASRTTPADRR
ncbi:MAG: hypothetical protein ACR2PG_15565 [Hyphomicrobiaceae bacterium]